MCCLQKRKWFTKWLTTFCKLMKRSPLSDDHKRAWKQFYFLLTIRSQIYMLFKFITLITLIGTYHGEELIFQKNEFSINNPAISYNEKVTQTIFPYVKWIKIMMIFGHLILPLISLRKPNLSSFFIVFECVWSMASVSLPNNSPFDQNV